MIDIIDDMIKIIGTVSEFGGRVYRRWPKKDLVLPCATVGHMGHLPTFTDANGQEVVTSLYYTVDINASNETDADNLAERVIDELAQYNMHVTGYTDFYDGQHRAYRAVLTFNGTVDRRGNTFT